MSKEIERTVYVTIDMVEALYDMAPEDRAEITQDLITQNALTTSELMNCVRDNLTDESILSFFSDAELRRYMEDERGFVCRLA